MSKSLNTAEVTDDNPDISLLIERGIVEPIGKYSVRKVQQRTILKDSSDASTLPFEIKVHNERF